MFAVSPIQLSPDSLGRISNVGPGRRNVFDDRRTCADDASRTNPNRLNDIGPGSYRAVVTDTHTAAKSNARSNMDVLSYQAIVLNRAFRIENACFANLRSAV